MCLLVSCTLVLTICFAIVGGAIQWKVDQKVNGYGQDLVLFCEVENCCSDQAGWSVNYNPIFLDVRRIHSIEKAKYDATVNKTGFSLIIRRLMPDDLNKTYICTHGFEDSSPRILGELDAFLIPVDEGGKEHKKTELIIGCLVILCVVTASVILYVIFRRRFTIRRHIRCEADEKCLNRFKSYKKDSKQYLTAPVNHLSFDNHKLDVFTVQIPLLHDWDNKDNANNKVRATSLGVKDEQAWLDLFTKIGKELTMEWKDVGQTLGLPDLVINSVDMDNSLEEEKACSMLHKWRTCKGRLATKNILVDCLNNLQLTKVAEIVENHFQVEFDETVLEIEEDGTLPLINEVESKALLKGKYKSYGNKIYLAGACNVGKSTLASLLIGDKIPLEWRSTDGLRIFFGMNGIDMEKNKMVPIIKDKGNQNILTNVFRGQSDIDRSQPDIENSLSDMAKIQSDKDISLSKSTHDVSQQKKVDIHISKREPAGHKIIAEPDVSLEQPIVPEDIEIKGQEESIRHLLGRGFTLFHEGVKQELKTGKYTMKIAPSDLVDFGGQKSYDMTHQLFIQCKGTFTLIFDGRKGLFDPLTEEYPQGNVTTESILKHWVDSILTYCGDDDNDSVPVILFVATHKDLLQEDEQSKRMAEFKKGIMQMFQNHDRNNRIKYNDIFFINATDENDPEVCRLQNTYVDIAIRQKSWGNLMPISWVPLELQISELRANKISLISKYQLKEINKKNEDLALTDNEFDGFLKVQHLLGKIMYFEGQGMANFIIIQPTTMADILRSFITDEMFWPKDPNLKKILKEMTETGRISKIDLFKLWSQEEFNRHMPSIGFKEYVAKVLTYLDLLVEPKRNKEESKSNFFLVPCMIKRTNLDENIERNKVISLSYIMKSSIPSALSFKLIGAVSNVWPLKETNTGVCLYHNAAVLCIDKSNELQISVRENRIEMFLRNDQSKDLISPDIASCAQECVTHTLTNALKFYHNSFGKMISEPKIRDLFYMEVGETCIRQTCCIPLSDAQNISSWKCESGQRHNTKCLLYWTYDKKQESCTAECAGLADEALLESPTEQHLVRLAGKIDIEKGKQFFKVLGVGYAMLKDIEYKYPTNAWMSRFTALCEWNKAVQSQMKRPTFKMLSDALYNTDQDIHWLCQIFRENRLLLENENRQLQLKPDDNTLHELSRKIGNCALHLGVELGIETPEIERTIAIKDIFEQNYDILTKWRQLGSNTTLRSLMRTLQIVDPRGLTYLANKYNIRVE